VIDAALAIAERDGVAGLSMRALSRELGVPIMTLYGYVPNKRALDALVADAILAEVATPEPDSGTWDVRLRTMLCDARRVLVKRPQLAAGDATAGGSAIELVHGGAFGREATRLATAVLDLLEEGGFGHDDQLTCFRTLFIYVTGYPEPDDHAPLSSLDGAPTDGPGPQEAFAMGLEALIHGLVHLLLKDASTNR
jgi:AcrR family transcriptional regulator